MSDWKKIKIPDDMVQDDEEQEQQMTDDEIEVEEVQDDEVEYGEFGEDDKIMKEPDFVEFD